MLRFVLWLFEVWFGFVLFLISSCKCAWKQVSRSRLRAGLAYVFHTRTNLLCVCTFSATESQVLLLIVMEY